ncbi:MAG TPA: class I SAM-dependent methyltransferase [Chloroflexi bacterium]|nr:class I SAM-dependent methyltransferase [Chloroflexota bacterium]
MDDRFSVTSQYATATNLRERMGLHERFSIHPTPWFRWVFELLLALPPEARILEIGCGTGALWRRNLERLPTGWRVTLTDASEGMLATAQAALAGHPAFSFSHQDAQALTFAEQSFDVVIANHLLYHVPCVADVLREVRRVLRPGGSLYASTVGERNMHELWTLAEQFAPGSIARAEQMVTKFTLENGAAQLRRYFENVTLFPYEDALRVTEAEPLVAYLASTGIVWANETSDEARAFTAHLQAILADGAFDISKYQGVFCTQV